MIKKTYLLHIVTVLILFLSACGTTIGTEGKGDKAPKETSIQHTKEVALLEKPLIVKGEKQIDKTEVKLENVQEPVIVPIEQKSLETSNEDSTEKTATEKLEQVKKDTKIKNESVENANEDNEPKKNTEMTDKVQESKPINVSMIDAALPANNSEARTTPITHIVIHFTSNVLANPGDPFVPEEIFKTFIDYGVSAHYLIGRNGEIYQLVSEGRVAYHAGKGNLPKFPQYKDELNDYSIGIELAAIGTKEEMESMMSGSIYDSVDSSNIGYTGVQYNSLNHLLDDIFSRYPSIKMDREHIVGHDEYAPTRKTDPGSLFDWSIIGF